MTLNSLIRTTTLLNRSLNRSTPWSELVIPLLALLKLYSTGLSLPLVTDELTILRRPPRTSGKVELHQAKLLEQATCPDVWKLSLSDGRHLILFVHSAVSKLSLPIPTGVTLTFAAALCTPWHYTTAHEEVLHLAVRNLKAQSARDNTGNASVAQRAETLSQAGEAPPKWVCYPTSSVLFHLHTFPAQSVGLPLGLEQYTLQKVWDERSLAPLAIYAHVTNVDCDSHSVLLQDSMNLNTSQPSVQCRFAEPHRPFLPILQPGCKLLLLNTVIEPTGGSFHVQTTPFTVCMFCEAPPQSILSDALTSDYVDPKQTGSVLQPPLKRVRPDSNLSLSVSPVGANSLSSLQNPASQAPFVVHGRLTENLSESPETNKLVIFKCGITKFRLKEASGRLHQFQEGDELVFTGVQWSDEYKELAPWVAEEVANISAMRSILFAPFMTNRVQGAEVLRRLERLSPCSTAHVRVYIRRVQLLVECREARLHVVDAGDTEAGTLEWDIAVVHRGWHELFHEDDRDTFWNGPAQRTADRCKAWILGETWSMTLTCNGAKWPLSRLSACVVSTPPAQLR